ncbi:hypothetical protein ASG76_13790 [Nocardioides sp. Soil774]|uniref:hypothetical protein n=1 Tax=Nocardioides sp. Soil774 TaxID=1736408 RepID=UPI0006F2885E|nr:hypothetical protein [Nocardioides sp. Soil774]KRE93522.1 hypothetical protein ASG76_13790 [Nocardioides sp. Soil774]
MVALTRWTAAALAAAGWLVVLHALCFRTPSTDPALDLDAGGAFALNVDVYLPAFGLSLVLLAVLVVGAAVRRPDVVALVLGLTTAGLAGWTLRQDLLRAYFPGLTAELLVGASIGMLALMLGVLTWRPRPVAVPAAAPAAGPYA